MKINNNIKKTKFFYLKSILIFYLIFILINYMNIHFSLKTNLIIFLSILIFIGIYHKISIKNFQNKKRNIISTGTPIKTKFHKFKLRIKQADDKFAVILILKEINKNNFFETELLYIGEEYGWLKKQEFNVYIDKVNPKQYYVDIDIIINSIGNFLSIASKEEDLKYKNQEINTKTK